MTKLAIQVENLGKEYIIGGAEQRHDTFRESLTGAFTSPLRKLRKLGGKVNEGERFWALKDISFDVQRGEVLGIVGRNGAGKSTLLKVLSRITSPTNGRIVTCGRVASLLEVGTGFHPELTGRENIYLNGAILGMSRVEIDASFDQIVAFAEIDKFLDTPVKRYSSGMYVRLAFAVAAHLDVDILIVDEVLAVGDQAFQKKCLGKMGEVSRSGRTVLFVSHNMGAISSLCNQAIFLKEGQLDFFGDVGTAVKKYHQTPVLSSNGINKRHFVGGLSNEVLFSKIQINRKPLNEELLVLPETSLSIDVYGESRVSITDFDIYVSIFKEGVQLITLQDSKPGEDLIAGQFHSIFELPSKFLRPGTYSISVGGSKPGGHLWVWGRDLGQFTVLEKWLPGYEQRSNGIINTDQVGRRVQIKYE